jgi:hypothetical protein
MMRDGKNSTFVPSSHQPQGSTMDLQTARSETRFMSATAGRAKRLHRPTITSTPTSVWTTPNTFSRIAELKRPR